MKEPPLSDICLHCESEFEESITNTDLVIMLVVVLKDLSI